MFGFGRKKGKRVVLGLPGLPFPGGSELEHILIPGATGSGKTQVIHYFLDPILAGIDGYPEKERAIITDSGGALMSTRVGPGDCLLNPFDRRSVRWNPFSEIQSEWDYAFLAESCIPTGGFTGQDADFRRHAQALLADLMKGLVVAGTPDPRKVQKLLSNLDPEALTPFLTGSESLGFLSPDNSRFFGSVAQVCSQALRAWSALEPEGTFSIRRWVREGKGCLFLAYQDSQLSYLRPLLGAWLALAVREVLSLPEDPDRRVWFVMDELDSLGTVDGLKDALTKGRKYGLSAIAAIQSIAQMRERYGSNGSQTLASNFVSKLIMRQGSGEDGKYWADEIGQQESEQVVVNRSHGSSQNGNGGGSNQTTSRTAQREIRHLVLPSELMELPKFCGYARISGLPGIRAFRFQPRMFSKVAEPFLPKEES